MSASYINQITAELNLKSANVQATMALLAEGATVPFIARYRKEVTGSLDEVQITAIRDRLQQLKDLDKRRETVLNSLTEQGKLTDELKAKIIAAPSMSVLEDIYLPFRPKRRTRATIAKEKGLEGLAKFIFEQPAGDPQAEARQYLSEELKVETVDDALAGARDIIAEWINENAEARSKMRRLFFEKGSFYSKVIKGKEKDGQNYQDYFDWQESVKTAPSHRILAARRGEKEEILMLSITVPEAEALGILDAQFVTGKNKCSQQVQMAVADSYKRLLAPSMETEIRIATKEQADKEAIKVFVTNLRQLLLAPPLGQKNILAIDPGFRTGCKVVCLDGQGKLLHNTTIYPTDSNNTSAQDAKTVKDLCERFKIEFIAIGNGTASRETENFIRAIGLPAAIHVMMVNESGASIYSASDVAREEFPDHDVTVRGSISIGRRLLDPLAELVKIDPKSIGVGQYQHDVDQPMLKQSLDDAVISCVNLVGVELNSASKQLLTYVSGIGPTRAQAIIVHRNEHGPFCSRLDMLKIPGFGPKAYEQAAGFLRIRDGEHPLDASAVHPERYSLVDTMARDLNCNVRVLMSNENLRRQIDLRRYVSDEVGLPTLQDIMNELAKPGRDPRDKFEVVQFKEGISRPEDLKPGMKLPGVVTNIANFGAFVDVGVHLDGLVHISQMSDKFVRDPNDVLKLHQKVKVTVLEVDLERKRISLSMKNNPDVYSGGKK